MRGKLSISYYISAHVGVRMLWATPLALEQGLPPPSFNIVALIIILVFDSEISTRKYFDAERVFNPWL